jgi:mannose-6-phosphate isomerase
MPGLALLKGTVKHYDWGGDSFIPSLLNFTKEDKPYAEYWLGVHPQAGCQMVADGKTIILRDYIAANAAATVGEKVKERFGTMPYLLKALDVKDMLSIQVHPSKKEAEKDFAAENAAGIPLDAPNRNYKDDNHKPELMVAMGDFWLLHGFKPQDELVQTLQAVAELHFLLPVFEKESYKGLYKQVMEMPQQEVNEQLQPLLDRVLPLYENGTLTKNNPDYWAAKAQHTFSKPGRTDRGIFSIYIFNLVHMKKGEAIFQDAGVPHAYIEGQNVEIMASSDNVLRGGLTPKHIDVAELLKHTKCEATYPQILKGTVKGEELVYETPAPDFELSGFHLKGGAIASFTPASAEILLLVEGTATIQQDGQSVKLQKGAPSAIVFPGGSVTINAETNTQLYKAAVPVDKWNK